MAKTQAKAATQKAAVFDRSLHGNTLALARKFRHFVARTNRNEERANFFCISYCSLTTPMMMLRKKTENIITET